MVGVDGWRFQQEAVRCCRKQCKKCPHGPYWYAYRVVKGKQQKRYVGINLPDSIEVWAEDIRRMETPVLAPEDDVLLSCGILVGTGFSEARKLYRRAVKNLSGLFNYEDERLAAKARQQVADLRLAWKARYGNRR